MAELARLEERGKGHWVVAHGDRLVFRSQAKARALERLAEFNRDLADDLGHEGTRAPGRSGYVGGCRCPLCVQGNQAYMDEYKATHAEQIRKTHRAKVARHRAENPEKYRAANARHNRNYRARKRAQPDS